MATDDTDAPTLVVPESVREEILAHAREGAPEEICGILAGSRGERGPETDHHDDSDHRDDTDDSDHRDDTDDSDHRVEAHHPAENAAETPRTRYEIDPREQLALLERIEESGREVVGFYHSHPAGPPGPSATDAAQATWPGRSYVIVSLGGEEVSVGSWRWTGEEFVAETVQFVDEDAT
ncbi:desampylase [Halorussus caseinilyticus]|uniref:Desampylase n=1 Tax=Halorussus caseinilyticus TaxID=3034025 RepID=A0ABD5WGK5_9EURY|nr:desampylase [Halorussus sp. DT72]